MNSPTCEYCWTRRPAVRPEIAAEHVDIKEGTVDGEVTGNVLDGRGLTGANTADSWIDVKGSRYRLIGNFGTYTATPGSVFANGYEIHEQFGLGYGCGNVFTISALSASGRSASWSTSLT